MWKPELIWVLLDRTCSTPMAERTNHTRNIAPDYFRSIYSVFWFTLLKCIQQPWLIDKNIRNYCAARPTAAATKAFTHRKFIAHAQFYVVTANNSSQLISCKNKVTTRREGPQSLSYHKQSLGTEKRWASVCTLMFNQILTSNQSYGDLPPLCVGPL